MFRLFLLAAINSCAIAVALAQSPGDAQAVHGDFDEFADELALLRRPEFQKSLDLTEPQLRRVQQLDEDLQRKRVALFSELRPGPKMAAYIRECNGLLEDELQRTLADTLIPQQIRRLNQVKIQMQIRQKGLGVLTAGTIAEQLSLTEEQSKKLRERQAAATKKLKARIEELRSELEKEILVEVLTPAQCQKLESLTGERVSVFSRSSSSK